MLLFENEREKPLVPALLGAGVFLTRARVQMKEQRGGKEGVVGREFDTRGPKKGVGSEIGDDDTDHEACLARGLGGGTMRRRITVAVRNT